MSTMLMDSLKALITKEVLAKGASLLGESEGAVAKGLGAAVPAVLGGLLSKAGDGGAMRQIFDLISDRGNDGSVLTNVGNLLQPNAAQSPMGQLGGRLLSSVLGNNLGPLGAALGQFAGLKSASASSLLGMAAPLVLGVLGNRVRSDRMDVGQLVSMLRGQRESITGAIPAPALGLLGLTGGGGAAASAAVPAATGGGGSWAWAIPLLALLGVVFYLCGRAPEQVAKLPSPNETLPNVAPAVDAAKAAADAAAKAATDAAAKMAAEAKAAADAAARAPAAVAGWLKQMLPGGIELNVPPTGIEARLLGFIQDAARPVDKDTWFDFDRLLFETGSATLTPSSQEQVKNMAAILKAFPAVKVKIGGYTDNTGNAQANLKLSDDRAKSVVGGLTALGIAADRLEAEGYGDAHAVADNATEEGRAKNRRIALRVTAK